MVIPITGRCGSLTRSNIRVAAHLEVVEDKGDMVRYGEVVPGRVATYYRDGKKIHSFKEGRWSLSLRAEFMRKDGFDVQVLIPDNRQLIYEVDAELGRQLARAYNDTVAEDIQGDDRFIGVAWIYLPDINESIKNCGARSRNSVSKPSSSRGWGDGDLDNEVLFPLYEEIAALDIPILLHPAARVFELQHSHPWLVGAERFQGFQHFPTALGFPLTYMVSAARLIFSGTLDRFPTLKFGFFEGGVGWCLGSCTRSTPICRTKQLSPSPCSSSSKAKKASKNAESVLRSILYRLRVVGVVSRRHRQRLAESQHHHRQRLRPRRRRRYVAENGRCDQADEKSL